MDVGRSGGLNERERESGGLSGREREGGVSMDGWVRGKVQIRWKWNGERGM